MCLEEQLAEESCLHGVQSVPVEGCREDGRLGPRCRPAGFYLEQQIVEFLLEEHLWTGARMISSVPVEALLDAAVASLVLFPLSY